MSNGQNVEQTYTVEFRPHKTEKWGIQIDFQKNKSALWIDRVDPGLQADQNGLKVADCIIKIDGMAFTQENFAVQKGKLCRGDACKMTLRKKGEIPEGHVRKLIKNCTEKEFKLWLSQHKHRKIFKTHFAGMSGEELWNSRKEDILEVLSDDLEKQEALAVYKEICNPVTIVIFTVSGRIQLPDNKKNPWGITLNFEEKTEWEVVSVDPKEYAAKKKLSKGHIIVAIDGWPITEENYDLMKKKIDKKTACKLSLIRHKQVLRSVNSTTPNDKSKSNESINESDQEVLSVILKAKENAKELDLKSKKYKDRDVSEISEFMKKNTTVEQLILWKNLINDDGAKELGEMLKSNSVLKKLAVGNNFIGNAGVQQIFDGLNHNSTLIYLRLANNRISDNGIEAIAPFLNDNKTLTKLDIDDNMIGDKGATSIADVLNKNKTLLYLYLNLNDIGNTGAEKIGESLKCNSTLRTLSLFGNNIGSEGAKVFLESLKMNSTLQLLNLSRNNLTEAGIDVLKEDNNDPVAWSKLYF